MNFRLPNPEETLPTEVTVLVPTVEGVDERTVQVSFHQLTSEQFKDLAAQGDAAMVEGLVASWSGVSTHDGETLACTEENRLLAGSIPCFARAVISAYSERIAPVKNS